MAFRVQVAAYGGHDEPIDVTFEPVEGTVFIKIYGETIGGLSFDRNDRGAIRVSLNYNHPSDGEWMMKNPITVEEN